MSVVVVVGCVDLTDISGQATTAKAFADLALANSEQNTKTVASLQRKMIIMTMAGGAKRLMHNLEDLERVRPQRLYETVIDAIGRWVETQKLKAGDLLPTERALEAQLVVSRPVIREAFRVLETNGVIASRQGGGRRLLRNRIPSSTVIRETRLDSSRATLLKLWDAREATESKAAELAAINATKKQIIEIFEPLDILNTVHAAEYRATDANLEFHIAVARASANMFLIRIILELIEQFRHIGFKYLLPLENWDTLQSDHRPIANAIKARDSQAAKAAMSLHFQKLRTSISRSR